MIENNLLFSSLELYTLGHVLHDTLVHSYMHVLPEDNMM